jgi:pimeloyl-ACP methyl ester carboxylesterase
VKFKAKVTIRILTFFFIVGLSRNGFSEPPQQIVVNFQGQPQQVNYDYYIPPHEVGEKLPVLVCVGGLPIIKGQYVHSDPRECRDERWEGFARENHLAILGIGFLFDEKQWENSTSYQFPQAWSGEALLEILRTIAKDQPINSKELFLFGISAGAQFSVRFAQLRPDIVKGVAAHAAGGYDLPQDFLSPEFFITVGELDNKEINRLVMAREFYAACRKQGIAIELEVIPGIAHRQTEQQNEMSREFFQKILNATWKQ